MSFILPVFPIFFSQGVKYIMCSFVLIVPGDESSRPRSRVFHAIYFPSWLLFPQDSLPESVGPYSVSCKREECRASPQAIERERDSPPMSAIVPAKSQMVGGMGSL